MKKILSLIFCFSLIFAVKAQNPTIDSLKNELAKAPTEKKRIDISNELIQPTGEINLDSAIVLGNKMILESRKIKYKWGEANALTNTSGVLMMKGDFEQVKKNLDKAEGLFTALNDTSSLSLIYGSKGQMYGMQSQYDSANCYYFKAVAIQEAEGTSANLGRNYGNIAIGFLMQSKYQQALKYQQKGLEIAQSLHNTRSEAYIMLNMGITYQRMLDAKRSEKALLEAVRLAKETGLKNVEVYAYSNLASLFSTLENWNETYKYALKAAEMGKATGDVSIEAASYSKAALALAHLKRYDEAKELVDRGMADAEASGQPLILAQLHEAMGKTLLLQEKYEEAIPYYEKTRDIFAQTDEYDENIGAIYQNLAKCYEETARFDEALTSFKKYAAINDSIRSRENVQKGTEQMMTYEFEKTQEAQRADQKRKDAVAKARQWVLAIVLALSLMLVFVIYRALRSKKKSNAKLQAQKEEVQNALLKLKSTQSQLIQAEKMASLGELTAGIAHEIQNPLNFVNNFSEVSKDLVKEMNEEIDNGNYDYAKEIAADLVLSLDKINHHGKRADGIVKGMLQHSRASSDVKEPTNINTLADEYFRLAYHGLRAKDKSFNATLETNFDKTIGTVDIARQDIGRVVLNLITNAFYAVGAKKILLDRSLPSEAHPYQPTVIVSTKKLADGIEIRIHDNGNGIPDGVKDKIFQPFFTTKPTGEGTGLGLSLSYDIVKKYGGELTMETKEGKGTTFIIFMPGNGV